MRGAVRGSLLDGAFGTEAAEVEGALDGVLGVEAEVVRGGPEPEAGDLAGVAGTLLGPEADEDIVLAGSGEVGGRIGVFKDEIDVIAAEGFFEGRDFDGAIELDGNGHGVAMEDGRVGDLQSERGPTAGGKGVVMAANAGLCVA